MKNIIIFASGNGSNAEQIISHLNQTKTAKVDAILTNKANAGVLERAKRHQIPSHIFSKTDLESGKVLEIVNQYKPDLIVLAGFLLKFPEHIINVYPNQVINIHPALLPNYGGKGMYGMHVHDAVLANKESYTGITIHYVNENYDEGAIIKQEKVFVGDCTTADEIATRIHQLEYEHFPTTINKLLSE
ncbi:phosphoribosylglycinamide formyltransferase [Flavobacterium agricola]|uniref:Phosphoribosylglycinamide formyltransferase n=1 Tax=Flavobacterium agricola TaxID=2870839 RepID=A0ABY6M0D7_9FLAO|nr:phosphoribosylglycinamide formyltransferase [Flavobacterium agricola]UYW00880.1 phosphoribosylglycinamide formyltransferase [Flavobacterium agricola]